MSCSASSVTSLTRKPTEAGGGVSDVQRFRDELYSMLELNPGRVDGKRAKHLIDQFMQSAGASASGIRRFWASPNVVLGPFHELPDYVQRALRLAAAFFYEELNHVSSKSVRDLVHGGLGELGGRLVSAGWSAPGALRTASLKTVSRLGRVLVARQKQRAFSLLDTSRFTDGYEMPVLYALLVYCDCDIASLIEDYVAKIPADREISPVVRVSRRNSDSCLIIGVDALLHEGVPVFIETNMNPGFEENRLTLFPDGDPVCRGLIQYAIENDLHRITFYSYNGPILYPSVPVFSPALERAWAETAAAEGIELRVVDSPQHGAPGRAPGSPFPDESEPGHLFAFARDVPSAISRILGTKGRIEPYLEDFNESAPPGGEIRLPRQLAHAGDLPDPEDNGRFPNFIVKNRIKDNARGISLHRSNRIPDKTPDDLVYEYVVPDLEFCDGPQGLGEYAFILRIYVLLSPNGARCIGVRKDISSFAVPKQLRMGEVADIRPYISNGSLNSYYVLPSRLEEEAGRAFGLKVGACLMRFLEDKYDLMR